MPNEHVGLTFDEIQRLTLRGLAPESGDVTEALSMDSAREIDAENKRIAEEQERRFELRGRLKEAFDLFGFNEPSEVRQIRKDLVSWVAGRTEQELKAAGLMKEFGERWGIYQDALKKIVPREYPTRIIAPMILSTAFYTELHWDRDAQSELAQIVAYCDGETHGQKSKDVRLYDEIYFELLGYSLLIDDTLKPLFEKFKHKADEGNAFDELDFGCRVYELGNNQRASLNDIYDMIPAGVAELEQLLAIVT